MLTPREQLANYQAKLLDALFQESSIEATRAAFQQIADATEQPQGELDPRMLDVAAKLTKKWGIPKQG